jgi:hypothetical protein
MGLEMGLVFGATKIPRRRRSEKAILREKNSNVSEGGALRRPDWTEIWGLVELAPPKWRAARWQS